MRATGLIIGCVAVAALSALVVAPAPAYDPWSWLLWGREVAHGTLSTVEGPAFKPLPVAVTALLSPLGADAAPVVWVVLARGAAFVAVALAFVGARRLGGVAAGVLAAAGVALCGAYPTYAASGDVTGLFLALALAGLLAWWAERPGAVLACALACALLRVEAWPFALALGVVLWRRHPTMRVWLAGGAVLVPLAWFVPEGLGSGDVLRSGERARVPNPGQPAEADVPALASLWDAVRLPLVPLLVAALLSRRTAWLAAAGGAWLLLVAVMAQAGFSGEPRYALPGAAAIAVAGAVAIATLPRPALVAAAVLVTLAAVPRLIDLEDLRLDQRHRWHLAQDLGDSIDFFGGRKAVLRCGMPYVGPYRGPLLAYRLEVAKERVEPDATPRPPGIVFRSRLLRNSPRAPGTDGFDPLWGVGTWEVYARCG